MLSKKLIVRHLSLLIIKHWLDNCIVNLRNIFQTRSEEHTSELQSRFDLVCRLLLVPDYCLSYTLSLHDALPIYKLVKQVESGDNHLTLLGATGTGKTFTISNVVEEINRPTLVIAHKKTLAGQLYSEFKEYFPDNAVEYFVSYYDYYQPEAYVPSTDTFIEKDASINDEIDKLRHSATSALFERRDVMIVASVSCIYG